MITPSRWLALARRPLRMSSCVFNELLTPCCPSLRICPRIAMSFSFLLFVEAAGGQLQRRRQLRLLIRQSPAADMLGKLLRVAQPVESRLRRRSRRSRLGLPALLPFAGNALQPFLVNPFFGQIFRARAPIAIAVVALLHRKLLRLRPIFRAKSIPLAACQ